VREALPQLGAPDKNPELEALVNAAALADDFASVLQGGGAYKKYRGDDTKAIGQRACQELFGDHPDDQLVFRTTASWTPWFLGIAWDYTWVGIDKSTRQVWLLCVTDTD
jgi:hypothetical protein